MNAFIHLTSTSTWLGPHLNCVYVVKSFKSDYILSSPLYYAGNAIFLPWSLHFRTMDLYLVPNNPENTVLVSVNGVAHYQIQTLKPKHGPPLTLIQRPADSAEDSIVAEVEWRYWDKPTIFRSPFLSGVGQSIGTRGVGVRASHYLHKRRKFSSYVWLLGSL